MIVLFFNCSGFVKAQQTADLGVQIAAAAYWGNISSVNYSKSVTPLVGVLGRWNFNKRLALRGQLFTGNLKTEDLKTEDGRLRHAESLVLVFPCDA